MIKGIGVSPGIVIGKAYLLDRWKIKVKRTDLNPESVKNEVKRFHAAVSISKKQLNQVKQKAAAYIEDKTYVYILDVHLLILEDEHLINHTVDLIETKHVNAEWALRKTIDHLGDIFDQIDDSYFKERKSDLTQVGERVLRALSGNQPQHLDDLKEEVIVVAHDLSPADTAHMYKGKVLGFATDLGGRTSHTSILAKSLEIPAVVGLGDICSVVRTGDPIILDGNEGAVIINPPQEVFTQYLEKQRKYIYFEKELLKLKDLPAETVDGYRVELMANIEFPHELDSVISHGAEGIGLYRTEYLYLDRRDLPDEEEQFQAYKILAENLKGKPAIIRTLDLGGDKIEPHLHLDGETNPALGVRAIRYAFKRLPIFKQQLRAILRAATCGHLKIMLPMISGIAEFRQALEIMAEVKMELWNQGIPYQEDIEVGSMIEIPSAAMTSDLLAREVDFFSLGTNDLIQYSLAIDRGNEQVAYLYQPLHPAILRTVKMVVNAAHAEGIPVGMCGEMAGDPLCTLILLGLEIDELSMNAVAVPNIKQIIRSVKYEEAVAITNHVFSLSTYKEIETFVAHEISHRFPEIFCSYN